MGDGIGAFSLALADLRHKQAVVSAESTAVEDARGVLGCRTFDRRVGRFALCTGRCRNDAPRAPCLNSFSATSTGATYPWHSSRSSQELPRTRRPCCNGAVHNWPATKIPRTFGLSMPPCFRAAAPARYSATRSSANGQACDPGGSALQLWQASRHAACGVTIHQRQPTLQLEELESHES